MFARAADFAAVGGFNEALPIMEDADLCIRMHEAGPSPHSHSGHRRGTGAGRAVAEAFERSVVGGLPWSERRRRTPQQRRRRGRVRMVLSPVARTSGRRLEAWGNARATRIHFALGLRWYAGATPAQLLDLYHSIYTDSYR